MVTSAILRVLIVLLFYYSCEMDEDNDVILIKGLTLKIPSSLESSDWKDDVKEWPATRSPDIIYYLLHSKACDLEEVRAYKSLESYNYLESGWVGQLLVHVASADIRAVKGEVTPSQAVNRESHSAWIYAKTEGEVLIGGCTCMAGSAGVCSHVGAILWKIDYGNSKGLTGAACTDLAMSWNKGTKKNVVPAKVGDISFKKKTKKPEMKPVQRRCFDSHKEFISTLNKSLVAPLIQIPGSVIYDTMKHATRLQSERVEVELLEEIEEVPAGQDISVLEHDHSNFHSCLPCRSFYESFVEMTATQLEKMEQITVKQSESQEWQSSRLVRITSSTANQVPKKSSTTADSYIKNRLFKPFRGNHHTKRGTRDEPVARQMFILQTGNEVCLSGTVICKEEPWLSASPDGLIGEDTTLEIKCPNPEETPLNVSKIGINRDTTGNLRLSEKSSRGYYMQVQIALHCTKRSKCIFYVWTVNEQYIINVSYNRLYVLELIVKLKAFYFTYYLPALTDAYYKGGIKLGHRFVQFCNGR